MPCSSSAALLQRLIAFPSVHTAPDYAAITDHVIGLLAPLGVRCHRMPDATGTRAGLFAATGPEGPGGVLLSAHLDVVPAAGQDWSLDPFAGIQREGRIFGRGATDMKGFAACAIRAMARAAGRRLKRPLKLAFSYDEESGCVGISEMIGALEDSIGRPELCLVGEPTGMRIATGHKGKLSCRATVRGEPGHSAEAPRHLNALHLAADFVGVLRRMQAEIAETGARNPAYAIPHATIHVGWLAGGTALNMVPARAELEFEIRHLAEDDVDGLLARVRAEAADLVAGLRARHPAAAIGIREINRYPGFDLAPGSAAEAFIGAVGGIGPTTKVNYGTDGGVFAAALGLPVIVCGPGDMAQGHKPDEFIELAELAACDAMLDRIVDRLG
ncbi:acetylornithine deacetylase [Paralimibaculum aggregatum]|uniref:Acetylornithine deacetylase n=1 Tax=Paralimibaculum aggregatum TaxID=3036245 RepID=A0ABQ6LSG0_9RHOB|nr:acetylornithine deacetylase [Limibaculum sp. NKW23]GMG85011.1 acetylornithine deacetylase [Limibaculum sp. NKW23]